MKEKAAGLIGTIIGIVGYLVLKEWFVSMGLNSFLAIILAIITMIALVFGGAIVFDRVLNMLKSDEQKAKEKEIQDEYAEEIARKLKEEENNQNVK
jgi:high-affinity Fe2+/Pb2+ permease